MKIAVVYGTQRKGSTYHIVRQFLEQLNAEPANTSEFFLPRDMPFFCRGCFQCINNSGECPDSAYVKPVLRAMEEADLLIFASPVYVYHASGQMKAFLDHFAFQWMPHRPDKTMFGKQALIVSTAAGAGTKSTIRDIYDSMLFWGVAKTYRYGKNVAAASWENVSAKKKEQIQSEVSGLAAKIKRQRPRLKPAWKVRALFYAMRFMHKKFAFSEPDAAYWKAQGWTGKARPWR